MSFGVAVGALRQWFAPFAFPVRIVRHSRSQACK